MHLLVTQCFLFSILFTFVCSQFDAVCDEKGANCKCEAGQGFEELEFGQVVQKKCNTCGMGRFSEGGDEKPCQLCNILQFQSCEGQRSCKSCPGGTTHTDGRIECETAREVNREYFREIFLYNPKKENNTCNGEVCNGLCAKFNATRRDSTASCPEYYIISWTTAEGKTSPTSAVEILTPKVREAIAFNNNSNTPIEKFTDASSNIIYYIGIPTRGCGMQGGYRPADHIPYSSADDTAVYWNSSLAKDNTGKDELHEYCIQKDQTPGNNIIETEAFSVSLEAVVQTKRGTAFTFTPMWETTEDCANGMYLNNTHHSLRDWRCYSCPDGADCSGKPYWSQVKAKFGYFRLDPYDAGVVNQPDWPDVFWPCAEPEACLGGENIDLESQYKVAVLGSDIPEILALSRKERCNDYPNFTYGYRQICGNQTEITFFKDGTSNRCLLCRACAYQYFPSGLRRCLPCPPWYFQVLGGIAAIFFVVGTLFVFLKAALDSDSSPHAHLAQPLQKIVLNHLQLVSLSSSFPLKWPKLITSMFDVFENLANAAAFIFQPQCTRSKEEDDLAAGKSDFFENQLFVLSMPFIAVAMSILFWTVWEAKSFGLFVNEIKEKVAEKARVKPLTAAELFKLFHRFAVEDHKHQKEHKHKHRHRHHAHHDRLSHHGVHDLLFAICHDHRHSGLHLHLSSKKQFDLIFQQLNPAKDDEKVEFASVLGWYNQNVKQLVEQKSHMKVGKGAKNIPKKYVLAIHIANEGLEIHTTLILPIDSKTGQCILRLDDKNRTGKTSLKGNNLSLPQGDFSKLLYEGLTKKERRKSMQEEKEKEIQLAAEIKRKKEEGEEIDDTSTVNVNNDLSCELRVEAPNHMELQILSHSKKHDIHISGNTYETGDCIDLESNTLVQIGETEVLFDIVLQDMYKNLQAKGHRGDIKRSSSTSIESLVETKIRAQMHAPTRKELEEYFHAGKKQRLENPKNKDNFPGLTLKEFDAILRKHPEIFGHLWPKEQVKTCYENMESHVLDAINSTGNHESNQSLNSEPTEQDHFRAFEEFAFHYFMERRHHLRKLEYARERHEARRRTTTLDTRVLAADKAKRMGYIDKVIATVITLIYLLYPTLCRSAFSLVACREVGYVGKSYLTQDLQVECFAELHTRWFWGLCVPALLILVIGLPGSAMLSLYRSRKLLHRRYVRFRFSILFIGYEDRTYYWEIVVAIRKLTVSAISVFLLQVDTATQVLTAELFVVVVLVFHLHVRPYIPVTPKHNTLQHAETFALATNFITLVSGMLMFEDIGAGNQAVEYIFTFLVLAINAGFILTAFWWWLTLKLMDLENLLEHTSTRKTLATKAAECLKRIVPDWEAEGQQLEIEQEKAEAVEDLRHVNLDKLMRVQKVAHKWVAGFKRRKGLEINDDGNVNTNKSKTKVKPSEVVDNAAEKAHDIEVQSERAARKFMKQMEDRVAKAHDRLESRKRRRSSVADPNTKLFVVPDGVELNDMGFKLKVSHGKVVVYDLEIDSPAYAVGVRNKCVLMRCNNESIADKTLVSVLKNAKRPLKLTFSARKHRPSMKQAAKTLSKQMAVAKAVSGGTEI